MVDQDRIKNPVYNKLVKKLLDKIDINIMVLQQISKENIKAIDEIEKFSSKETNETSKNSSDIVK